MTENKIDIVDAKEFDSAVAEAENTAAGGSFQLTVNFKEPFVYEGKTYDSLTFDWDRLTGADYLAIETDLRMSNKALVAPEFSGEFLIRMAAKSCREKVSIKALQALPISVFNRICNRGRSFLLVSAL